MQILQFIQGVNDIITNTVSGEYSHIVERHDDEVYIDDHLVPSYKKGAYRTVFMYGQSLLIDNCDKLYVDVELHPLQETNNGETMGVGNYDVASITTRTCRYYNNVIKAETTFDQVMNVVRAINGDCDVLTDIEVRSSSNVKANGVSQSLTPVTVYVYDGPEIVSITYNVMFPMQEIPAQVHDIGTTVGIFPEPWTPIIQLRLPVPPVKGCYYYKSFINTIAFPLPSTNNVDVPNIYNVKVINKNSLQDDCSGSSDSDSCTD